MKETIADVSSVSPSSGLALETSAIVSFTAFHYPHQHTVDTPVFLRTLFINRFIYRSNISLPIVVLKYYAFIKALMFTRDRFQMVPIQKSCRIGLLFTRDLLTVSSIRSRSGPKAGPVFGTVPVPNGSVTV